MILYTYSLGLSQANTAGKTGRTRVSFLQRWTRCGRLSTIVRDEVTSDDDEEPSWSPVRIERIELFAPTARNVLLLNEGIEPLIRRYEIVETIT
ncbi:hypothetical protein RFM99_10850 [Mesorhizobium sp. VK4C]|uniref:hypothetical protein n=1 Tax=Mesorhizobium captivum TaxID=3072319 RepID=UPI002A23ABF1|nr:hypothetical protein [Mesorhizobium sp. VK4C]MDX8498921.1 hypothetical protein [Mesorhizobium sp. VK4C]